jgi:bidirectional [NiFe] hydrogenase diaphorase subunit
MFPDELVTIAEQQRAAQRRFAHRINVCTAAGCLSQHSDELKKSLDAEVATRGLKERCEVRCVGCMGLCAAGPLVTVDCAERMSKGVRPADVPEIVAAAAQGQLVERLRCDTSVPFFTRQQKIVLENSGLIDPEQVEEYIAAHGYEGLLIAVATMQPADVIEELTRSGLRGRGGAGFPTGLKWATVAKARGDLKFVVCNADEGDPGAFMDRSVLESDPHRVLEGMAIAAYAVGAHEGYIYVRAEYPLAVSRLKVAIRQAEKLGLLGSGILGSRFDFKVEIRLGAGAFVCGEETALIASIEGNRGTPRPRPPYPAERGLWGCPTLINNVETFANVPPILRNGGDWFASIGTDRSKGTKVFALAGRVNNTGLIEIPMGITLREIIFDVGGGIPNGARFKAVQTGGPSGGCVPEQFLDIPVDYDSLVGVGTIMGSGGMIVMDQTSCMVDVAKFFLDFCRSESCGKCVPCRVGTAQMYDVLQRITDGLGTSDDLMQLEELCDLLRSTSLCGLGQTAPNPVLTTLKYFRDEYLSHMNEKRCGAGVCHITPASERITTRPALEAVEVVEVAG